MPRRLIPRPASATLRLAFGSEADSPPRQAIGSRARSCCQEPRCRVPLPAAMAGQSERRDCRPHEAQASVFGQTVVFRLQSPPPRVSQTPEEALLSSGSTRTAGSPLAIVSRLPAKTPASGRSLEGTHAFVSRGSAYRWDNDRPGYAPADAGHFVIQVRHARGRSLNGPPCQRRARVGARL